MHVGITAYEANGNYHIGERLLVEGLHDGRGNGQDRTYAEIAIGSPRARERGGARRILGRLVDYARHFGDFFSMSRSSVTRASSRFNCRISASLPASPDTTFPNRRFQA
jgi:hypothetical protein